MIGTGIGLGLAGYRINPAGGPIPVLDINFRDYKTFSSAIGPTASFSRASTATYFDQTGVLRTAAINAGRINHVYNGTSWISRGLLIEEQRTNICLQSNSFNTTWGENSGVMGIAQNVTGPDGTSNSAWTFTDSSGNLNGRYQSLTLTNGATYTESVFIKKTTSPQTVFPDIHCVGPTAIAGRSINTTTGDTYSVSLAGYSTLSNTVNVSDCGDFWRISVTFTANATDTWYLALCPAASGTSGVLVPSLNGSAVFYGAMFEAGSFGTSYIPTTTASTTRSTDVCQISGTDFSGIWNANEGTAVAEFDLIGRNESSGAYAMAWQVDDNTLNNRLVQIAYEYSGTPSNAAGIYVAASGSGQANMYGSAIGVNTLGKTAFAWKENDFALSVNGAAVSTDTSGTVPTVSQLNIGRRLSDGYLNGHMARLRVWNQRLNDGTLRSLAT